MSTTNSLRERGLRVTRPRVAVLDALEDGGHLDVDQIRSRVLERLESVSVQTVYDVLAVLDRHDLVRRIEPAGSPALYELRVGDNHHHLVCRGCGSIEDVDCSVGASPCLVPNHDHGYVIDEAEVTWWGWCPACQSAENHLTATPINKGAS